MGKRELSDGEKDLLAEREIDERDAYEDSLVTDPATYIGKVKIPEGTRGEYKIRHVKKEAGISLPLSSMRTAMFGGHKGASVHFPSPTVWHELSYEGGVWMTDLPIEQYQHNRELRDAYGRVFVGGLGIGYACNLLASLEDVDEVVCVEIAQEVIDLVAPHLLDPEDKVRVVHGDAMKWPRQYREDPEATGDPHNLGFDIAFLDIWQRDGEDTFFNIVKPFRDMCDDIDFADHVICWNEDIMRGQMYLGLRTRFSFTQAVDLVRPDGYPTVEELATPRGDKFWDWAVPFWKRVAAGEITEENFENEAAAFVRDF